MGGLTCFVSLLVLFCRFSTIFLTMFLYLSYHVVDVLRCARGFVDAFGRLDWIFEEVLFGAK